jgi:hypothetical protein
MTNTSTQSSALHCITCWQLLPKGEEPGYFVQDTIGRKPTQEIEKAGEDLGSILRYLSTINEAISDIITLSDTEKNLEDSVRESAGIMEKEEYLERAKSLCFLLADLFGEAKRRERILSLLVCKKAWAAALTDTSVQATGPTEARKEG